MKLILAPMHGMVDSILRKLLTDMGGFDLCVSEFIRVTNSLLPVKHFQQQIPELNHGAITEAGIPVVVQLLGSDPHCMADNAARAAEIGAPGINLNFGCPAPTVNRHRGGAALLNEPSLIHGIVYQVRQSVPKHIPVTAKMRLGIKNTVCAIECAQAITSAGADALVVHPRTRTEAYQPPAHWEWIARINETVSIPIIANGEVWTLQDYLTIRKISGCQDVMLGRGAVADPQLASRIASYNRGNIIHPLTTFQRLKWIENYFIQCYMRTHSTCYASTRVKQWLRLSGKHFQDANDLFLQIRSLNAYEEIFAVLRKNRAYCPDEI